MNTYKSVYLFIYIYQNMYVYLYVPEKSATPNMSPKVFSDMIRIWGQGSRISAQRLKIDFLEIDL